MRFIGLDVHREFCEVAIAEEGRVRSAGRIRTRRAELELFAQSLGSNDEVALESTGGAVAIARILEAHVARVVVVNTKKLRQISEAKAKTDRLDARRLAELLAAGYLAEVWCPDEQTRALRRLVARRAQLVRQRSRAKNEIAAALQRNLLDRPGVYDVAGARGRRFLEGVELPDDERQTVEGCLRQIDFLDEEIAAVNRALAEAAVGSREMRRLMSVPGVNLQTAATFMACVGDIGRFRDPRKLVSYLRWLASTGVGDTQQLFFEIALEDVRRAAELLRPAYDITCGPDGYASFECAPDLADDAQATNREPASGRGPCRTPRRILGTCSAPQANHANCGQVGHGAAVRVSDAATPTRQADDSCIREVASARAALPPRSPWTTSGCLGWRAVGSCITGVSRRESTRASHVHGHRQRGATCRSWWSPLLTRPPRDGGPLQSGRLLRQCIGKLRAAATRPARSKPEAGALAAPAVG